MSWPPGREEKSGAILARALGDALDVDALAGIAVAPGDFIVEHSQPLSPEQHKRTPDGDYTAMFLEAGTTFTVNGVVNSDPIPVERAWVADGVLRLQGRASWAS